MIKTIFNRITDNFFEEKEEKEERLIGEIPKMTKVLEMESLTCRKCNDTAYPVWGTSNKYKCTNCNNRFTNGKHNLINSILVEFGISHMSYTTKRENELKIIYEKCFKEN